MPEDSSNTKTPRHKEYEQSFGDQRPGRERNRAAIANRTTSDKAAASVCCFGLIDLCLIRVFVPLCRGWLVFSSLHSPRLRSREASPSSLGRSRAVSPISRMNCIARFLRLKPGSSPLCGGETVGLFPNLSHLNLLFSTISVALFRQKIIQRLNRTFDPSPRQENGPAEQAPWLSVI